MSEPLPQFTYFPDPVGNGCIEAKAATCTCCGLRRSHMYTGPIYSEEEYEEVCPWCIANGRAAEAWSAVFNDVYDPPAGVSSGIVDEIECRTPGYSTWQGNIWLFSPTDALVFLGHVGGKRLLVEGNVAKIDACLAALKDWRLYWSAEDLRQVIVGGQPAIYLFQDRSTGAFQAYADMT